MENFTISAYIFTLTVACGKGYIQRTPSLLIVGNIKGEILKCEFDNPKECKILYKPSGSAVWSTVVRGEYLYAYSIYNDLGYTIRCEFYKDKPCTIFHRINAIYLAAVSEYLFAGLADGRILRCSLKHPNSCLNYHSSGDKVRSIFEYGEYIYVATTQTLSYCQKDVPFSCLQVETKEPLYLYTVARAGKFMVTYEYLNSCVTYYNLTSKNALVLFEKVTTPRHIHSMTIMNNILYLLTITGDLITWQENKDFKNITRLEDGVSMIAVYGVHGVRSGYEKTNACDQRPSTVFNYDVERRAMMEVTVVDGILRDARGTVVDTRYADIGYSGRAAIFAMGPDGQLLLSHAHSSGLVHISSLFAGHPVAGAGEIVVEDGIVKRIIACSTYYWPDIELNRQVVDGLMRKGYENKMAEEILLQECDYTCDENYE